MKRGPNRATRRAKAQRMARIDRYIQALHQAVLADWGRKIDHAIMTAFQATIQERRQC